MTSPTALLVALALAALPGRFEAQALSRTEQRIRDHVYASRAEAISLLERSVNINSGTMTHAGVRAVGDLYAKELAGIGFETRWAGMPPEVNRAGHLVAERRPRSGNPRGKRLLPLSGFRCTCTRKRLR